MLTSSYLRTGCVNKDFVHSGSIGLIWQARALCYNPLFCQVSDGPVHSSPPYLFHFFPNFFFRGPGQDDTEQIDISYYSSWYVRKDLMLAFRQSGFASPSNESEHKFLPCSLGTFVKASSKDPECLECPAGNFSLIYDMRFTHLNRKDKHVHLEISVMIFFFEC